MFRGSGDRYSNLKAESTILSGSAFASVQVLKVLDEESQHWQEKSNVYLPHK